MQIHLIMDNILTASKIKSIMTNTFREETFVGRKFVQKLQFADIAIV